ncbi:MAG: C10 family peptidase [Bacteroidaceae bacterium]|nr:C10 family peptidase [Bacteroidaceae bacterium]
MKRSTLFLLALCTGLMALAEPIGKRAALYTAKSYLLEKGKQINASQTPYRAAAQSTTGNQDEAYYYVFNAGDDAGYVIVSGDDRVEPILGYVDHGSFDPDNIPVNMRTMLQMYSDEIKYVIDNDIQPGDPRIKGRNKVAGTRHSVPELLTTRWNQGHPYNLTCPQYYDEGDTTLTLKSYPATGCTATAMAQTIAFYRYPNSLRKNIPSYTNTYTSKNGKVSKTLTRPAIARGSVIDWDNMRDVYNCNDKHAHDIQDTAVANLMLYCGQSVKMGYGPSSGANFDETPFIEYFGFDSRAYRAYRNNYSIDEWFELMYRDISAGFPVCYAGFSSGGGHAFVIDGFDGDNLFHVNWGWGGGSNGWFLISILNPGDNSGIGASSSSDGYSMGCYALFNLRLPGAPKDDTFLSVTDVTLTGSNVKVLYKNRTGAKATFHGGIVMLDENGELELVGTKRLISSLDVNSSSLQTFRLAGTLPEGVYKLSPASKPSKSEVWHPEYDFDTQYIEAVVDSLGEMTLSFKKDVPTYESLSIDTIVFPGSSVEKEKQEVKVTFRNNGKDYLREIHFLASKTQEKVYTKSRSLVAVRAGETVDVSYFFTPETTGLYNLWFATDDKGNNVVGQGTMNVISAAQAAKASLTVSSYTIDNLVSGSAYGKCLVGSAKIKNNKNVAFDGRIRLTIWSQPNGSGSAYGGTSKTYEVSIGGSRSTTINFSFDGLEENTKYYFSASYVDQGGELGNGGVWDLGGWMVKAGAASWKTDGSISGISYKTVMSTSIYACGVLADCSKAIRCLKPNNNPNTIYVISDNIEIPDSLEHSNVVHGKHANRIDLFNDRAYYLPASFKADTTSFTYTFPETEDGTKWHAFTMPFSPDSIFLDDQLISLDDTLNQFLICEFSGENSNNEVCFRPATSLRGGTAYIIAAHKSMAGRSLVFRANDANYYKTGTDPMIVSSKNYMFHGNTYSPKLKNCYVLNEEGTAFDYITTAKALPAMSPYFTTELPDSVAPTSIVLPDLPFPSIYLTLDEMATNTIEAGTFDEVTLKRTFDIGFNTICLPFQVDDVAEFFGENAQAYEFYNFVGTDLNFIMASSLTAGQPYIIIMNDTVPEEIVQNDITINEESIEASFVTSNDANFLGTYNPLYLPDSETVFYDIAADGTVVKLQIMASGEANVINGFRAYFELLEDVEGLRVCLYDDATGIADIRNHNESKTIIYNLAGQRLSKAGKGVVIINGKKVLK